MMASFCLMVFSSSASLFETVSKLFEDCLETVLPFPTFGLVQNFKTVFSEPNSL